MLSTDRKGAVAELAIAKAAIALGIDVYRPVGEGGRYDLIFDLDPELVRVQCKWATLVEDRVVQIRCYSCRRTRDGQLKRTYSADQIDAIAAYCSDLDRCFFIRIESLGERATIQLRLQQTRNNQRNGVNWADDYAFERLQSISAGP